MSIAFAIDMHRSATARQQRGGQRMHSTAKGRTGSALAAQVHERTTKTMAVDLAVRRWNAFSERFAKHLPLRACLNIVFGAVTDAKQRPGFPADPSVAVALLATPKPGGGGRATRTLRAAKRLQTSDELPVEMGLQSVKFLIP